MGYDELLCAACSGRVVDGGCPTCRVSRETLPVQQLPAQAFLLIALALAVLLAVLTYL